MLTPDRCVIGGIGGVLAAGGCALLALRAGPKGVVLWAKSIGLTTADGHRRISRARGAFVCAAICWSVFAITAFVLAATHESRMTRAAQEAAESWKRIRVTSPLNDPAWREQRDREAMPDWMKKQTGSANKTGGR